MTEFLGVAYDDAMLQPPHAPYHFMYSGAKMSPLDRGEAIRLDERWRSVLTPKQDEQIRRAMRRVKLYRELYPDL